MVLSDTSLVHNVLPSKTKHLSSAQTAMKTRKYSAITLLTDTSHYGMSVFRRGLTRSYISFLVMIHLRLSSLGGSSEEMERWSWRDRNLAG